MKIVVIETPSLGDRSYLVHDGKVAVVIDPQRDIDRILGAAETAAVRITHVFETHIHNDYVTGGLALAQATGAGYVVSGADPVGFGRLSAGDGDTFKTGLLELTAKATPGHTEHHLAYELAEPGRAPTAVFTGGSMLYGAVGRTDLVSKALTGELTRAQYRSVRRLVGELDAGVEVYPTHGFGSFCSATRTAGDRATIGEEIARNIALTIGDEDEFCKVLVSGLTAYPRYYSHMGPANLAGPPAPNLSPAPLVEAGELRRRIDAGEWVVDLRPRRSFAASHVKGTISIELGDSFATYLGWTIPWGTPLTLLGDSAAEVACAQRELVRIGIESPSGRATHSPYRLAPDAVSSYPVASFADLSKALGERRQIVVLDVRRPDEWEAGHVAGAVHVPFFEVESRAGEIPPGGLWVHCASGFRAAIATSLLERAGRQVVHVDDDWDNAVGLGLSS
ncbi:MAG: MBL fold metallo-hydrolase [Acidimicrobiales bacterium]